MICHLLDYNIEEGQAIEPKVVYSNLYQCNFN